LYEGLSVFESGFQFAITPIRGGWVWETWERDSGHRAAGGVAETKALAAALVVRAIARSMVPGAAPEAANAPVAEPAEQSRPLKAAGGARGGW
jgi:hypothetical protein